MTRPPRRRSLARIMEVHHSHSGSHGNKSWKSLLLEFAMLFAAVTLGFFAENLREHHVERERESTFIAAVHTDVLADVAALRAVVRTQEARLRHEETLLGLLEKHTAADLADLYYAGRVTSLRNFFLRSSNGFQQLKYAGGLRLIGKMEIIRALQAYEGEIDKLEELQSLTEGLLNRYRDQAAVVFRGPVFRQMYADPMADDVYARFRKPEGNPELMTTDPKALNELMVRAIFVHTNGNTTLRRYQALLAEAEQLAGLLEKNYKLKRS
ncbi:MAG: hypothetical protein ACKODK_06510 [Opitutaceae bacterium]